MNRLDIDQLFEKLKDTWNFKEPYKGHENRFTIKVNSLNNSSNQLEKVNHK